MFHRGLILDFSDLSRHSSDFGQAILPELLNFFEHSSCLALALSCELRELLLKLRDPGDEVDRGRVGVRLNFRQALLFRFRFSFNGFFVPTLGQCMVLHDRVVE